jgi:hypothetical protein
MYRKCPYTAHDRLDMFWDNSEELQVVDYIVPVAGENSQQPIGMSETLRGC